MIKKAVGIAALVALGMADMGSADMVRVRGLSPEEVSKLPSAMTLFNISSASESPRLLDHPYVEGEVVARFPLEYLDAEVDVLARMSGAVRADRLSPFGLFLITGEKRRGSTERLMQALWETHAALEIDANYIGGLAFVPDDPHHVNGNQWYHEATSGIDLDLTSAWDITTGSSGVTVAVVDTGTRGAHPEFSGRFFVNPGETPANGIDDDNNGFIDDVSGWNTSVPSTPDGNVEDTAVGHGTWVASIALANTDNTHQVAGFDHSAKYLPIKALNAPSGSNAQLQAALEYLVANPSFFDVVNMSLANFGQTTGIGNALNALASTALLVGGSGNGFSATGADSGYPESHPAVITVAGTDSADAHPSFSDGGNSVEFSAPAVQIYTADWANPTDPNAAHFGDGTSFAAPMVTGIASLGLAVRPTMSKSDLLFALRASAVDLGAAGRDTVFGWGRVNAYDALEYMEKLIFTDDFETGDTSAWN